MATNGALVSSGSDDNSISLYAAWPWCYVVHRGAMSLYWVMYILGANVQGSLAPRAKNTHQKHANTVVSLYAFYFFKRWGCFLPGS